ncbi:unnamed protein product [Echinostoma caproni]|uniref:Mediator of RNA polymerase II transcription subunit 9 n=1 Tax=Echinostoma caproni TaxID=27848 RepID=A0A183BBX0_9TREM|nr:unnamed protein product [Echinostoma caproni]
MQAILCYYVIQNEALATIQSVLLGRQTCSTDSNNSGQSTVNFFDRLQQFLDKIGPVVNRLPLQNIQLPTAEMRPAFESDLRSAVATAKLFSAVSEQELQQLEMLAQSAKRFAESLRDKTIPQTEACRQQIQQAINLFSQEASLRLENIQRQLLESYQRREQSNNENS